jgi:hypothetical protein
VGISQLRERSDISFHFAARTALDASLKATSCIALEMPMEFWASDMGRPWRFSHAAPATRAAGLKRRRGPVRRKFASVTSHNRGPGLDPEILRSCRVGNELACSCRYTAKTRRNLHAKDLPDAP